MSIEEFAKTLNEWGAEKNPFLFLVDFEMEKPLLYPLQEIKPETILYSINGRTNCISPAIGKKTIDFIKFPLSYHHYKKKYDEVHAHLAYGDSYLTNLT